jgi:DNA-binding SARP family transcriptional activator/DNA-binding beta-propeller fold protein YncE
LSAQSLTKVSQLAHTGLTVAEQRAFSQSPKGASVGLLSAGFGMYYRVLGPLEIEDHGELLPLGGAKQRALLAVLLLHANEVVPRDVLIEDLWGEHGREGSVHSLEVQVSRLRKILRTDHGEALVTRPTGYRLSVDADELDLLCFERLLEDGRLALSSGAARSAAETLREALALWRGRPFEDVGYESFAQVEIERLEERRLAAVEERIEADLALGHHAELVAELEALVRKHPRRERLRSQLMLALYRSDRQSEALNAYQDARRELVDELGIEPSHALRRLEQAILRQDPELEPSAHDRRAAEGIENERFVDRRLLLLIVLALGLAAAAAGTVVAFVSGGQAGLPAVAPNSVGVIDPHSGKIVAEFPVGQGPTDIAADGGVWVANFDSGTLSRIDPRTLEVLSVTNAGGTPTGLAAGHGSVWVSNGFAGRVLRVDEQSGKVTGTIPISGHPAAVTADPNAIWVVNPITDSVARIDPNSLQVTTIGVGRGPKGIAAGAGSVWVANGLERTLTRIDSATGAVLRRRIALRFTPSGVAFGEGSVWIAGTSADAIARVNPKTNQSSTSIRVGDGPTRIIVLDRRAWVAETFGRTLTEIDPTGNTFVRTISVGGSPQGLMSSGGRLWVAARGT